MPPSERTQRIIDLAGSKLLQGAWRGAPCAVKFTVCDTGDAAALRRATREVVLSKRMSHPHVVCLFRQSPARRSLRTKVT